MKLGDGGLDGLPRRSIVLDSADDFRLPSAKELEKIVYDREDGTSFGWFDRLFMGWDEGLVFRYTDWECRDLADMLRRDYRARQLEAVLTYPSLAAERRMMPAKGDRGECEWLQNFWDTDGLNGGCETPLDQIIDQMTTSVIYKKAFWELVWTRGRGDFAGKSIYKRVSWRPQTTTRSLHNPSNGNILGFQQEPYTVRPGITRGIFPIEVLGTSQYVHVHGGRRDPINGVSDLEVCYWAYKTKQKILFLLAQFLTSVARPDTLIKAQDVTLAQAVARQINASNGGIIPVGVDGKPDGVVAEVLDRSGGGRGAEQYMSFIKWLDSCAVNAVLAGFLDLPSAAADGRGSNALSSDASDFFLMTLEHKNREYEYSTRRGLFAPIIRHNFGPSSKVPLYRFEPLNAEDKSKSVEMLQALMGSRDPSLVPDEFLQQLVSSVADYLGMDGTKLAKAFEGAAEKARQQAQEAMQVQSQMTQTGRGNAVMMKNAGNVGAAAGMVGAATRAVKAAKSGKDPVKAAKKAA